MATTKAFDVSAFLDNDDIIVEYLNTALETGDVKLISKAIGDIAKAKGMAEIAEKTGLGRESLYKALSGNTSPKLDTIQKVIGALGLTLKVA